MYTYLCWQEANVDRPLGVCVYVCKYPDTSTLNQHRYVYTHACMHACILCMNMNYVCTHINVIYMYMCMCMYVYIYVNLMYIQMHIYVMHTHTHTHTHMNLMYEYEVFIYIYQFGWKVYMTIRKLLYKLLPTFAYRKIKQLLIRNITNFKLKRFKT